MEGRLVVLPSRFYTILKKPGSFILPDVPPGDWDIKTIVFHRRFKSVPLKVSVGDQPVKNLLVKVVRK
jgi:hypothetical protein